MPSCLQDTDPVMKLGGQMGRTETGRVAWYIQPAGQASVEYSLPCPCYHLVRIIVFVIVYIIFKSDLALRVGTSSKCGLKSSFKGT